MKPEKKVVADDLANYEAVGIPREWAEVLQRMGYITVDSVRKLAAGKLLNDLGGFNKKNKLGLKNPTMEQIKAWVGAE